MKYKVGDRVRVRSWESMEKEFGLDEFGYISMKYGFTDDMEKWCGEILTIECVMDSYYCMKKVGHLWTDDMLEPVEFDWDAFKDENNKIAVHCKTEEEAKDFCMQMHEHGMKWRDGDSYLYYNCWERFREDTCYVMRETGGSFFRKSFYEEDNYTILEWSDYMNTEKKEFTKSDLKYGYMVKFRKQEKALYMPSEFGDSFDWCDNTQCLNVDDYDENLIYKSKNGRCFDVIEVYGFTSERYRTTRLEESERTLLWKREEKQVVKMTVEEMKKKLSEIMNAEIVEQQ